MLLLLRMGTTGTNPTGAGVAPRVSASVRRPSATASARRSTVTASAKRPTVTAR